MVLEVSVPWGLEDVLAQISRSTEDDIESAPTRSNRGSNLEDCIVILHLFWCVLIDAVMRSYQGCDSLQQKAGLPRKK